MMRTFVLGGARSGKSAYAEQLAAASGLPVVYLATARCGDAEMEERIARHRNRRDAAWVTVEEPVLLGPAVERHAVPGQVLLVDCLTLWLSNLLFDGAADYPDTGPVQPPPGYDPARVAFLSALAAARGDVILVSNEVGMGITPLGAISRWFVDEAGRLNQAVAATCDRVFLVAAGLPLQLKGA